MVALTVTRLLHDHKQVEELVRSGQRIRVRRRGKILYDIVPVTQPKKAARPIDLHKLDQAMTALAHKANGRNIVADMRREQWEPA